MNVLDTLGVVRPPLTVAGPPGDYLGVSLGGLKPKHLERPGAAASFRDVRIGRYADPRTGALFYRVWRNNEITCREFDDFDSARAEVARRLGVSP